MVKVLAKTNNSNNNNKNTRTISPLHGSLSSCPNIHTAHSSLLILHNHHSTFSYDIKASYDPKQSSHQDLSPKRIWSSPKLIWSNQASFCLTNCIGDEKYISCHFGPIYCARRDWGFEGLIYQFEKN